MEEEGATVMAAALDAVIHDEVSFVVVVVVPLHPHPTPPHPNGLKWLVTTCATLSTCARCFILGNSIAIKNTTWHTASRAPFHTNCISTGRSALSIASPALPHTRNWFAQLMPLHMNNVCDLFDVCVCGGVTFVRVGKYIKA